MHCYSSVILFVVNSFMFNLHLCYCFADLGRAIGTKNCIVSFFNVLVGMYIFLRRKLVVCKDMVIDVQGHNVKTVSIVA